MVERTTYQLENDGFELTNTERERERELNIELYVFRFVEQT